MLCGLSAGLSMAEMRVMRVTDVANIVGESTAMQKEANKTEETGTEDEIRDATQADIEWLKTL